MTKENLSEVNAFANLLGDEDLMLVKADITNPAVVDDWLTDIALRRTVTVLAFSDASLVALSSLYLSATTWTRHIGEFQIIVDRQQRNAGIGKFLTSDVIQTAQALGLRKIIAHMIRESEPPQRMLRGLEFQEIAVEPGFAMSRDGTLRDLLLMGRDLPVPEPTI